MKEEALLKAGQDRIALGREIRCVQQLAFLNLWDRLRGDKRLPHLSSLQPDDLTRIAEQIMFCDVARSGERQSRFSVRYQGSQIRRIFAMDATGLSLEDPSLPAVKRSALQEYQSVADSGEPHFRLIRLQHATGVVVQYERLLLPFTKDSSIVTRIVSVLSVFCEENGFPRDILKNSQVV